MKTLPGSPYPLGATWDGLGVNFALFSEHATQVTLCLFDSPGDTCESQRVPLREMTHLIWHTYIPGLSPGQLYGYRVDGTYDPVNGHRFNAHKIVLDPYAKLIGRDLSWCDEMFGYTIGDPDADLSFDERDNAASAVLAAVSKSDYSWRKDRRPKLPWHKTVIYELHVKGFTKLHHQIPPKQRGTFAGLASPPVIAYLKDLGVTTVELMPVHHRMDDRLLVERGLSNYWGYNTLSFFSPDLRYCAANSPQKGVQEFKRMVRTLHSAGIEVILDVVYNHTAEGSHLGPTLSLRGIDNANYYRLTPDSGRYYMDFTGCGNTLNMQQPRVLQLIMDSLRYWVLEMHVDGFRFDLASSLARELHDVNQLSAFFNIILQDPVLSQVILIAEPWDLGEGGYQVGNFPVGWAEWNGKYRDSLRRYWRGEGGVVSELATRLCGSSDLYEDSGRLPHASVNFVTSHDGFTLQDLVSYDHKHNEANGEENTDGDNHNLSWNCGVEGPTDDIQINALRERQKRNFLATLLLSLGIPMIRAGDEHGHSQQGNNNAYCHDDEISWIKWEFDESQQQLYEFVRNLIRVRQHQPALHRRKFLQGRPIRGAGIEDVSWFDPSGNQMTDETWQQASHTIGVRFAGDLMDEVDESGNRIVGDTLLLLLNGGADETQFTLPEVREHQIWRRMLDTQLVDSPPLFLLGTQHAGDEGASHSGESTYLMASSSLVLFCTTATQDSIDNA